MKNKIVITALIIFTVYRAAAQQDADTYTKRAAEICNKAIAKSDKGDYEGAMSLFEKAQQLSPNSSKIKFDIGSTYLKWAATMTNEKKSDYYGYAADAYKTAINISPNNGIYYYNLGAVYFNQAIELNDRMNLITGSTSLDLTNYNDLKERRYALFIHSLPFFEKAYGLLSTNELTLTGDNLKVYKSTLMALSRVYAIQKRLQESEEMRKKANNIF